MKREGRQHGMVRSYRIMPSPFNPRPEPRFINRFESPPTAGLFTKVSTKPTNHSKFTGKCARPRCSDCHMHPASKSKDKTKGIQKLNSSSDVSSDCRLVFWRVVNGAKSPGLKMVSGSSATEILDNLGSDNYDTPYLDLDDDYDYDYDNKGDSTEVFDDFNESGIELGAVEIENNDDDKMSFCDLGIVWEEVDDGDEDWCLV